MSFNKKDLEIAYSLRWKNGPKREDKELSIISVYDIPATTLNFEVFKSYLLKNSGTPEQDVRVSYIMDNGREYPIQSQTDFHVALYAFRRKARSGELINLLLEKISEQPVHKNLRHSNDVETQFENMEPSSLVSTCCNADTPPEWFISYMAQMKKDITEEITATVSSVVSSALSNVKPQIISQPPCHHHSRKSKPEKPREKRIRKITPLMVESTTDAKDLIKSLKLDNKLEKLERKASKYREKRLALQNAPKSSDSEAGHSSSRSRSRDKGEKKEEEPKMDAKPVNCQAAVPHMLGGEVYLHQWEVENTGEAQWTSKTILQFTWGSKSLKPLNKTIPVQWLKPGEKGTVSARLQIPKEAGKYECYWQFMHKDRRFGHWLGCQVVVDPFDLKGHRSVLETVRLPIQEQSSSHPDPQDLATEDALIQEEWYSLLMSLNDNDNDAPIQDFLRGTDSETPKKSTDETVKPSESSTLNYAFLHDGKIAELSRELTNNMEKIHLNENLDSDSASSIFGFEGHVEDYFSSGNSSKDEFVVVPVPKCFLFDGQENPDQQVEKSGEKASAAPQQEQPGCSGTNLETKSSAERAPSPENNFDDNNNAENGSATPGNSIKLKDEDFDNIVVITVPKDEQVKEGYIYVHVDGTKVLIPKNILKSEVVNAAQELEKSPGNKKSVGVIVDSNESINQTPTPTPSIQTIQASPRSESKKEDENAGNTTDSAKAFTTGTPQKPDNVAIDMTMSSLKDNQNDEPVYPSDYFEANNYMSHCSAAGSCFSEANSQAERNSRLFIFPEHVPGYEVVNSEPFVAPTMPMPMPYNIPPTANPFVEHIPNFQQTPPEQRHAPVAPTAPAEGREAILETFGGVSSGQSTNQRQARAGTDGVSQETGETNAGPAQVHILPESLVSGAVNAASSAFSTARSVINMIKPQSPGRWINGHWVSNSPETPREANLQALAEMGFWNRDLNATLLARFEDDLNRVVAELVQ